MFFVAWEAARASVRESRGSPQERSSFPSEEEENAVRLSRLQEKRRCLALIAFSIVLLMGVMCVNFIRFDMAERARSITNGACLIAIAAAVLWSSLFYCHRPQRKQPSLLTFSWARLTFSEATQWKESAADSKPIVHYEEHPIHSFAYQDAQVTRPAAVDSTQETNEAHNPIEDVIAEENMNVSAQDCVEKAASETHYDEDGTQPIASHPSAPSLIKLQPVHGDEVCISPQCSSTRSSMCCPCCLGDMQDSSVIALLQCGHLFCEECLKGWALKSTACPYCRTSMLAS